MINLFSIKNKYLIFASRNQLKTLYNYLITKKVKNYD